MEALAATSEVAMDVEYDQPFNFWELEERSQRVQEAYLSMGLVAGTSFDIQRRGRITSEVVLKDGISAMDLAAALPVELRDSVDIYAADPAGFQLESIIGGADARVSGTDNCTTGFVVYEIGTNQEGVTTAGHCTGINEVEDHVLGTVVDVDHEGQHIGQWGDLEWKSDPTDSNLDDKFHPSASAVRDVKGYETIANLSVGETVCFYGRASNSPTCAPQVQNVSYSCLGAQRLVRTGSDVTIGGDSGGPWFYLYRAFGGHVGDCGGGNVFTSADYFDEALGVRVDST